MPNAERWRAREQDLASGTMLGDSPRLQSLISTCVLCYFARFRAGSSERTPFHNPIERERHLEVDPRTPPSRAGAAQKPRRRAKRWRWKAASPKANSSARARFMNRPMSCSSVMPMPPCICRASLVTRIRASEQRALAFET